MNTTEQQPSRNRNILIRRLKILTAAILALGLIIIVWQLSRPAPVVQVIEPQRREVVELVIASGRLRAERQGEVGAQVTGIVDNVLVEEGDLVSRGDVVIRLEDAEAREQLRLAELAVETARRQLAVVRRGPLPEEVERARAQLNQAQRVGQARLNAALERLRELEAGGRPAEIQRAQAQLQQTIAAREQAQRDYRRAQQLYRAGAISRERLDQAETAFEQARAAERAARQQLALTRQPAREEQIAAARQEVQAARAELQESVRIARANLEQVLRGARIEDIRLAESRVREAEAALERAREQFDRYTIKAPISGLVVNRNVEPGESVTPGPTLMTIADMSTTEIYVETDETNLPKLELGQEAIVVAPAYEDRPFRGIVTEIGPDVETVRGVIPVTLEPVIIPDYARPDMTVDVNIEVARLPSVLAVPATSVLEENGRTYVLLYEEGVAVRENVDILARGVEWVGVEEISPEADVIVEGTRAEPGQRVRIAEAE